MKNESPQYQGKEITTMVIELREGEKKKLKIYSDTNPEKLAYEFCLKNNLDFESLKQLTSQIKQALIASSTMYNTNEQSNFAKESQDIQSQYEDKPNEDDDIVVSSNNNNQNINNINIDINANAVNNNNNNKDDITKHINEQVIKDNNSNSNNDKQNLNQRHKQSSYLSPTVSSQSKTKAVIKQQKQSIDNNSYENGTHSLFYSKSNISSSCTNIKRPRSSINIMNGNNNNNSNNNNATLNYGERLYHKGLKLKEKTTEKLNIIKSNIDKENRKHNTFHPKINKISYNALSKRYSNKLSYNDEDNIINYKTYKEQKLNNLKQKYTKDETYSFTPCLNKRSLTIEKFRQKPKTPRYEQLYNTYKKQEAHIEEKANEIYNKNTMFKPKVNNYQCPYTNISFEERQKYYLSKSQERQKFLSDQLQNPSDAITGQLFFHPEINSNYERCDNIDIFDNLYQEHIRKATKLEKQINEQLNSEYIKRIQGHVNNTSIELIEIKKEKAFRKIFRQLDKDKDDLITKLNIDMRALPIDIQNIIEPIIVELKRENVTLNEEEFINACFKLYECLGFVDKRKILDYERKEKKNVESNFSFRPKINKNYYTNIVRGNTDRDNNKGSRGDKRELNYVGINDKNKVKYYIEERSKGKGNNDEIENEEEEDVNDIEENE